MIRGIGVDLCSISRIRKALLQRGFKEKIFSEEEINYAESKADPAKHYAAAFAAREALAKATGFGVAKMGLNSCSIRRTDNGPVFIYTDVFSEKLKASGIGNVLLSLSHEADIAIAMVVMEDLS